MESRIRMKATVSEMQKFFDDDSGVRFMEIKDSRYTKESLETMSEEEYNSKRFTFFVIYRHKDIQKNLSGTFTIKGLQERLCSCDSSGADLEGVSP